MNKRDTKGMGRTEVIHPSFADAYSDRGFIENTVPFSALTSYEQWMRPGDWLQHAHVVALNIPDRRLSPEEALMRLTNVADPTKIGSEGTVMAACAMPGNEGKKEVSLFTNAVFGRDALLSALYVKDIYPKLMHRTIHELAKRQSFSDEFSQRNDGAYGKISHEDRLPNDPSRKQLEHEQNWSFPYYGSEDATPLYIKACVSYARMLSVDDRENYLNETFISQDGKQRTIRESIYAATTYISNKLDSNNEGILEFQRKNPGGLANQAWKDSWDSYFHKDGRLANHKSGIASIEIQGYAYDALLDAAEVFPQYSWELQTRASMLRKTVMNRFWVQEDGGYFALGTDRDEKGKIRPLQIKTSNVGHLLNSRLLDGDDIETKVKRNAVIRSLFAPDMFATSGIRTLSSKEVRFNPRAYHNGTVWSHDNFFIAQGLERHGLPGLAWEIYRRIEWVNDISGKYPEFSRGNGNEIPELNENVVVIYSTKDQQLNCIEQVCQEVQAWAAAAARAIEEKRRSELPKEAYGHAEKIMEDELLKRIRSREQVGSFSSPI